LVVLSERVCDLTLIPSCRWWSAACQCSAASGQSPGAAAEAFDKIVADVPIGRPYKIANRPWGVTSPMCGMPPTGASTFPVTQRPFNFDRITFKIYLDETSRLKDATA
jgi:microcin C transport system substrate-binding protein